MKNAIIISLSSDIALALAHKWVEDGWNVIGTYRNKPDMKKISEQQIKLFQCDLTSAKSCDEAAENIIKIMPNWDALIFATGTLNPIGSFIDNDLDEWAESIDVNFVNQMRLTHRLINGLTTISQKMPTVLYFAGGGTNNVVLTYSAYTISKIALIKMCELLDAEIPYAKFTIIGPGWVKTKIHNETLAAAEKNDPMNYTKTVEFLKKEIGDSYNKVINFIEWIIQQPKDIVSGRNFSVVHDDIYHDDFIDTIRKTPDMYKLRRFMNESFIKRGN